MQQPTTRATERRRAGTPAAAVGLVAVALAAIAVSATSVGLVLTGSLEPPPAGLPDPGLVVSLGAPILRVLSTVAAVATIGWLLAAAVLDPSGRNGTVSRAGRSDLIRAGAAASIWALFSLVQMVFVLAEILGIPISQAVRPDLIGTYATEIPITRALLACTVLAVIVGAACMLTSTIGGAAAWLAVALVAVVLPSLAGHAAGLGDHSLALTAGVAHAGAAVLWIGGIAALAVHAARRDLPMQRPVERFSMIALVAFALVFISGIANAYTRLETPAQLLSTGYGQLVMVKTALIVTIGVIAWLVRRNVMGRLGELSRVGIFARLAGLELLVMAMAVGLGAALAFSAPPRFDVELPSTGELILGFAFPPPPTVATVVGSFRLEPLFLTLSLVAAGLYIAGVLRLRRRGDHWGWGRTISWLLGITLVIWCTNFGIATYAQVSVGLHMVQHMTLGMLAPILLVLGAPATLALRALRPATPPERGPREWLVWLLGSWITRVLTNPVFVFIVFVTSLYGLYFTPAFGWLMGSHVGHVLMQAHFILAGYLFAWVLIGVDPRPKPLPYWGRLVLLLLALAVHGFFAVALMMQTQPLAAEWYGLVRPPWLADPLQDTLNGGQVAWALAELPTLFLIIVVAVQWARSDDRESTRKDRQADRDGDAELTAYNEQLAQLSRRDESR